MSRARAADAYEAWLQQSDSRLAFAGPQRQVDKGDEVCIMLVSFDFVWLEIVCVCVCVSFFPLLGQKMIQTFTSCS